MNNLLCLVLISNKQKGFALPLALLIGLILMATGITMIMRAQGDQSKVVAQKARADGLTSSESGVTRVQDLLNSVRVMATVDSNCTSGDCWERAEVMTNLSPDLQKALKELATVTACSNPNASNPPNAAATAKINELISLSNGEWVDLNPRDNSSDKRLYRVVKYDYTEVPPPTSSTAPQIMGWGVLTLEGRFHKPKPNSGSSTGSVDSGSSTGSSTGSVDSGSSTGSSTGSVNTGENPTAVTGNSNTPSNSNPDEGDNAASRNRVVVTIPIYPSLPPAFDRTTAPALWVSEGATEDRSQTRGITVSSPNYSNGADFQGDVVMSDTTTTTGFVETTGTLRPNLECHINNNNIQQPTTALNPPYKAEFIDVRFPNLPPIPTTLRSEQRNLELTSSQTFPRPGDIASTRTINGQSVPVYEYIVNNIDLNGNDEITITPGQKVVFYVQGNITGKGNGGIRHNCNSAAGCKPGNLQIYAYNNRTVLGSAEPQICLRGREEIEAFIFAPAYSIGKTGNGDFVGAVWGKNWGKIQNCGSNNGAVAVTQGVEWTDLIQNLKPAPLASLPKLGNIANWCEESVNTSSSQCVPSLPVVPTPSP
jgi:hypothetical protein